VVIRVVGTGCGPHQWHPFIGAPNRVGQAGFWLRLGTIDVNSTIIQAINEKRLLALDYDPGPRIIEPCAYGVSGEGHFLLRAFQTSGASASGEQINWKLFRTDRIRSIRVLEERFAYPRPGYRRGDKAMAGGIYSQL
jgi:hypothetical protein